MKLKRRLACLIGIFAIPVILSNCKESSDIEVIPPLTSSQSVKPSATEIENFKKWYYNLESNPNTRTGSLDSTNEVLEVEIWEKAISNKQSKLSDKLLTVPLIDFKETGKIKIKQLYLTEVEGKKNGYKVEINKDNVQSNTFTGTVIIMSLDEKYKREYTYKDNKVISNKNSRLADFGNTDLPEVTVTAPVNHGGTWLFVTLLFSPANSSPFVLNATVEPCADWGCGYIDPDYDPVLVQAILDWIKEKILEEFGKVLNPQEIAILETMSTGQIMKFYNHYVQAERITAAQFHTNADDGHANAFKHVLFATLHTRDFGVNVAQLLTDAHEYGRDGCSTVMDLRNNTIGINLGASFTGGFNDLVYNIYQMAKNGQLWTVGGSNCVQQIPF